jgi:hypothetical protein
MRHPRPLAFPTLLLCAGLLVLPALSHAAPLTNGMPASDLLGQYDDSLTNPQPVYTKSGADNAQNILGFDHAAQGAVDTVRHRLFLFDYYNGRVLVYNLDSKDHLIDHIPDYVLRCVGFPRWHSLRTSKNEWSGIDVR